MPLLTFETQEYYYGGITLIFDRWIAVGIFTRLLLVGQAHFFSYKETVQ